MSKIGSYRKTVTALVTQALTFATLYYGSNHYVSLAVAVAGALGVYAVPNSTAPAKSADLQSLVKSVWPDLVPPPAPAPAAEEIPPASTP